ncbi:sensor histidine kinase [Algoriphagus sediminis]|uniref:Histidine kinase n=1 Tax=Algoriphagus sediminis TaxID=3057113 RepID=A0ABT7YB71_9BACT|nr:histidine kinase [Algoriphagus sediminis]MDN3203743.1 histidine kinase [Algoriphagus sediminis]
MKNTLALFSLCFLQISAFAQGFIGEAYFSAEAKYFETTESLSFEQVLEYNRSGNFQSWEPGVKTKTNVNYWVEINLEEILPEFEKDDSLYFYPNGFEAMDIYLNSEGQVRKLESDRFLNDIFERITYQNTLYLKIPKDELIEGNKLFLRLEYKRNELDLSRQRFFFSDSDGHALFSQYIASDSFKSQLLAYFFLGIASVLMVFNLILFYNMRERLYIYYGAFLLFQLMYYSRISPLLASYFGYDNLHWFLWLSTVSQVLINLSYLLFTRHFLDFKETLPKFDRVVKGIAVLLVLFALVVGISIWINPYASLAYDLMNVQRIFMATFAFLGVAYLWRVYPNKLVYFVVAGTVVFTTGALLTMFLLNLDLMVAGSAIESTIFALGLSYKIKTITQENQKAQLESLSSKLGALRAQINPHFIFNSLSSIQYLIQSEQKTKALSYLTKFSKFVRQVLENSIDVNVTLEKEIELLKVYLDLEALRFDHAFQYHIEIPENDSLIFEEVPMMIIQPFVENAIKHGLMPSTEAEKHLYIRFKEGDNFIYCEVEDNGIGREEAKKRKKKTQHRPSRGLMLTEDRLKLSNSGSEDEQYIEFKDLPEGTLVIIKIPKQ